MLTDITSSNSKSAILTVVLGSLLLALLVSVPFALCGDVALLDAFFEGFSALTTTGTTTSAVMCDGLILWRSIVQWFGGIVFIVLFVAVLPRIIKSHMFVFNQELGVVANWRLLPEWQDISKIFLAMYAGLTAIIFVGMMLLGVDVFGALNYALGIAATAKVDLYGAGLPTLTAPVKIFMGLAMLVAGGNYAFYYFACRNDFKKTVKDCEFCTYLSLVVIATVLIVLQCLYLGKWETSWTDVFCQCCSFLSTTGMVVSDSGTWTSFGNVVFMFLLFVGGCAGSAAGGLKICRFVVLLKQFNWDVRAVFHPKMVAGVDYNGKKVNNSVLTNITFYFCAYVLTVVVVALCLAIYDFAALDAFLNAVACVSNSGVVFVGGVAGGTLTGVSVLGKVAMMVGMLMGRLEIFMILVLLLPEFWQVSKRW